jgi:nucleoside 2-deoxyribosyltransferase
MAAPGKTASIIMPIHSDPAFATKQAVLARVEQASGWRIVVPTYDSATPIFDIESARRALDGVDLVIADLSLARPSCYFELGFAEALAKPIHRIAEHGTEIHQTSGRDAVTFYGGLDGFEGVLLNICRS